jgi:hypothetical protein
MTRTILGAVTLVALAALAACTSEPPPEPVESAGNALVAFDVDSEVIAADQGGCSMGEIRGCVSECYGKYPESGGLVLECRKVCNTYGCYRSCFCG